MLEQLIADGGSVQGKKASQPVRTAQPVQTATVKKSPVAVEEAEPIEELSDVEEADYEQLKSDLEALYEDVEVEIQIGGQPIYYYIVSVE